MQEVYMCTITISRQAMEKWVAYSAVLTPVFVTPEDDPLRSKHVVLVKINVA
jgi:hypothetical protein